MESESLKRLVVTPQFLRSAYELPKKYGCEVLKAIRLYLDNPGNASLNIERFAGSADEIQSLPAGKQCRILFSIARDVRLLFVGVHSAAQRFADCGHADATAFAEVPIAFQLHIDFWQTGPFAATESPSCGAPVSANDLGRLILRGRTYLPLAQLLLSRGAEAESIQLSFRELETALGEALPKCARKQPAWWANDLSHTQASAWLTIGWWAIALDLQRETIAFERNVRDALAWKGGEVQNCGD